jgi:hypothetical protein
MILNSSYLWIILSFILTLSTALYGCLLKYIGILLNNQNLDIAVSVIGTVFGIISCIYLLLNRSVFFNVRSIFSRQLKFVILILVLCACIIFFNSIVIIKAFNIAPNPGFAHLIVNLNFIVTTIISYLLFGSLLNIKIIIGMVISLLGVAYIAINSI